MLISQKSQQSYRNSFYLRQNSQRQSSLFSNLKNLKPFQIWNFNQSHQLIKWIHCWNDQSRIKVLKIFQNIVGVIICKVNILKRFRIINFVKKQPFLIANVQIISDQISETLEQQFYEKGLINQLRKQVKTYFDCVLRNDQAQLKKAKIQSEKSINKLLYSIINQIECTLAEKIVYLQQSKPQQKINMLIKYMNNIYQQLKITKEIQEKVRNDMQKDTRKIDLGRNIQRMFRQNSNSFDYQYNKIESKIKQTKMPKQVKQTCLRQFTKLKTNDNNNAEKAVIRRYIQTLLNIPWCQSALQINDIKKAQYILQRDHAGLQKVKNRILQYLAVKFLKGSVKGTILCLQGPPGVGKTSIAKSIAQALGRPFGRISLGGVHDQAQIKGHRRTYISALPGSIMQTIINCKKNNPVILLDQIDKITRSNRGDPSSALLEVLDPHQNSSFTDHYVALPFDLSKVVFIATGNQTDTIQPPLLDRMELINIPGYIFSEKLIIASKYLIPKQILQNGINQKIILFEQKGVKKIIKSYTKQAGVRQLQQKIASVCRYIAKKYLIAKQNCKQNIQFMQQIINSSMVQEILGTQTILQSNIEQRMNEPGSAIGLAYTPYGGKVLIVQTSKSQGKGKIQITGSLGDIMKQSVKIAVSWIKTNFTKIHFIQSKDSLIQNRKIFQNCDLHIHFPQGSIPKDGPSAGITITCALLSLLTGIKCKNNLAMTGEISLAGFVLPVGGIKQKCIAAYEQGIKQIIIPRGNIKNIIEIPEEIRQKIRFHYITTIHQGIMITFDVDQKEVFTKQSKL